MSNTITLYKYRSLQNFEFTADILINDRLYAANFLELNDPMEGIFTYDKREEELAKAVGSEKEKLRICSLSKHVSNPILWAHYADGFKGICIEVEVNVDILDIEEIDYDLVRPIVSSDVDGVVNFKISPEEWAKNALMRKFKEWKYEDEIRIFSDQKFISEGFKITAVYFGMRTSDVYKNVIKNILPPSVAIYETEFNENNILIERREFVALLQGDIGTY